MDKQCSDFSYGLGLYITAKEVDEFVRSKLSDEDKNMYKFVKVLG